MRLGSGLLLRGVRWRLGASMLTVFTAAIAVATAVVGPMYLHAAGDTVLRQTVASAAVQDSGVTVTPQADQAHPLASVQQAERLMQSLSTGRHLYGAAISTVMSGVTMPNRDSSQLFWRSGICGVLRFVRGHCDLGPDDVLMTARGARQIRASVGSIVRVVVTGRSRLLPLRVTGIVLTPDLNLPYWWGDGAADFPAGRSFSASPGGTVATDPLIASAATALAVPAADVPEVIGQLPLQTGAVHLGDESGVKRALHAATSTLHEQGTQAQSQLPSLLADADRQRRAMATIVAIAAIQLVLLAIWVLGSVLVRSSEARRSEARVARLRGFPGASMLWLTAAEPGLLCLAGVVLGLAGAWAAMLLARSQLLAPSAAIVFDGWTLAALGLTVVAIVGALGAGAVRFWKPDGPVDGSTRASRSASSVTRVVDGVLIVLAIVALVALGTTGALNGHVDPLASAAPGLIALGSAVVAVEVVLWICRLGVSLTAESGWVGAFLALRQSVRRPRVLRQARVLIIALGLVCFAAVAWSVARANRATTARFQVGATSVVSVTAQSPTGLQRAVQRADPRGRFAMAAIDLQTPSTQLLAVDSRRLSRVASWPQGISAAGLTGVGRSLDPPVAPAVALPQASLRLAAQTTATVRPADVDLGVWAFSSSGGTAIIDLGRLREGRRVYGGDLAGVCPGDCRLAGLGILPTPGHPLPTAGTVRVRVSRLWSELPNGTARPLQADLIAGGWRVAGGGVGVRVVSGQSVGLALTATAAAIGNEAGATGALTAPMASPADHPLVLPAVVTSQVQSSNGGTARPEPTQGLDGATISVRPVATSSALPRVGDNAVMVDLALLARTQTGPAIPDATDQVWLGPHAPADALAKLRAAGLTPTGVQLSSAVFSRLQRSGPALADDFLLIAAIAALLIAAASTLGALGATTRQRATELASLEVAGVPRPALIRSLGVEALILMIAALAGAGAGALAAAMAVPSLPELAAATLAPLQYALPWAVIGAVTLAVIATVAFAAGAVSTVLVREMSPGLLRSVPDDLSA
ncbi:MAG: ABC transporter permease [Solirubrobacteraceae bacterium]